MRNHSSFSLSEIIKNDSTQKINNKINYKKIKIKWQGARLLGFGYRIAWMELKINIFLSKNNKYFSKNRILLCPNLKGGR